MPVNKMCKSIRSWTLWAQWDTRATPSCPLYPLGPVTHTSCIHLLIRNTANICLMSPAPRFDGIHYSPTRHRKPDPAVFLIRPHIQPPSTAWRVGAEATANCSRPCSAERTRATRLTPTSRPLSASMATATLKALSLKPVRLRGAIRREFPRASAYFVEPGLLAGVCRAC